MEKDLFLNHPSKALQLIRMDNHIIRRCVKHMMLLIKARPMLLHSRPLISVSLVIMSRNLRVISVKVETWEDEGVGL